MACIRSWSIGIDSIALFTILFRKSSSKLTAPFYLFIVPKYSSTVSGFMGIHSPSAIGGRGRESISALIFICLSNEISSTAVVAKMAGKKFFLFLGASAVGQFPCVEVGAAVGLAPACSAPQLRQNFTLSGISFPHLHISFHFPPLCGTVPVRFCTGSVFVSHLYDWKRSIWVGDFLKKPKKFSWRLYDA